MAFKGSVCCKMPRELLLWEEGRTGMGSCWGKGIGDNSGEQGEELGGCRSPERSAEGASPSTRVGEAWK